MPLRRIVTRTLVSSPQWPASALPSSPARRTAAPTTPGPAVPGRGDGRLARGVLRLRPDPPRRPATTCWRGTSSAAWTWSAPTGGAATPTSSTTSPRARPAADAVRAPTAARAAAPRPRARTARPAPTCRRPASTSRTSSRPTAARCSGSRTATWSTYDVSGAEVERLASLDLPGGHRRGQHRDPAVRRHRGRALAPGRRRARRPGGHRAGDRRRLDPAAPEATAHGGATTAPWSPRGCTTAWSGWCSRPGCPTSTSPSPDHDTTEFEATRENRDVVRDSTIEDWLPSASLDGAARAAAARLRPGRDPRRRHARSAPSRSSASTRPRPDAPSVSGLAVDTDLAYASADQLYLATSPTYGGIIGGCFDCMEPFRCPSRAACSRAG